MLGKRSRPVIGKLAGTLRSGAAGDSAVSPRSPLDFKPTHSPKSFFSDHGGVGLGIIVSLDKSAKKGGQILPKYSVSGRSKPIAVISRAAAAAGGSGCGGEGSLEDYTYVTCRGPGNKAVTRVYYDAGGDRKMNLCAGDEKTVAGVFRISPARSVEVGCPSDFLSSCHLCRKALHGKDIYMYRGEKAFCSVECRQKQMVMDERKELCRSEASRTSGEVPYSTSSATSSGGGLVFSTGIIAI